MTYMFVNWSMKGIFMVGGALFWEEANLTFTQDVVLLEEI